SGTSSIPPAVNAIAPRRSAPRKLQPGRGSRVSARGLLPARTSRSPVFRTEIHRVRGRPYRGSCYGRVQPGADFPPVPAPVASGPHRPPGFPVLPDPTEDGPVQRTDRLAGAPRAAAALRSRAGSLLGRALCVAGIAAASCLYGTAADSADYAPAHTATHA